MAFIKSVSKAEERSFIPFTTSTAPILATPLSAIFDPLAIAFVTVVSGLVGIGSGTALQTPPPPQNVGLGAVGPWNCTYSCTHRRLKICLLLLTNSQGPTHLSGTKKRKTKTMSTHCWVRHCPPPPPCEGAGYQHYLRNGYGQNVKTKKAVLQCSLYDLRVLSVWNKKQEEHLWRQRCLP